MDKSLVERLREYAQLFVEEAAANIRAAADRLEALEADLSQLAAPLSDELIAAARKAVDDMDDFAKMDCSIDPKGPRQCLERFIDTVAAQRAAPPAQNHLVAAPVSLPSDQHGLSGAEVGPSISTVKHEVRQMLYQGYSIGINHYGDPLLLKDGHTVAIIKETVEAMKELKAMRAAPCTCGPLDACSKCDWKRRALNAEYAIRQIREAISTDSCDGDSTYAAGVNAAVTRHTEGIDTILREARISIGKGEKQNG